MGKNELGYSCTLQGDSIFRWYCYIVIIVGRRRGGLKSSVYTWVRDIYRSDYSVGGPVLSRILYIYNDEGFIYQCRACACGCARYIVFLYVCFMCVY